MTENVKKLDNFSKNNLAENNEFIFASINNFKQISNHCKMYADESSVNCVNDCKFEPKKG